MAQKITTIPASGKMPLDRSVKRLNALPDHPDLYFTSLGSSSDTGVDTAYGFAKNSALACVGDVLTVVSGSTTKQYIILNESGALAELYNSNNLNVNSLISAQLATYIPNIGFQGDLPTAQTAVKKGQEFRAGRQLVGTSTTVQVNDYLIAKQDFTLPASSSLNTAAAIETMLANFVVVEQNLTGAIVGISGATNNVLNLTSGKFISKIEVDSNGKLKFTESDLPVKSVTISGSGDVITGASYSNGVLTITKGNFPTIKHPVLHTLVFKTKTAGTGPNGIAYGAVTLSSSTVSVNLTAHAKFVPPVFAPARFRSSFIVAVNGITLNYLEDYRVSVGSNSEVVIIFTSESGVETDDNIAVTYQADPDVVSALNY